jgi:hypothetical protein
VLGCNPHEFVGVGGIPQRFIVAKALADAERVWAFHFYAFEQVYKRLVGAFLSEHCGQVDHLDC